MEHHTQKNSDVNMIFSEIVCNKAGNGSSTNPFRLK